MDAILPDRECGSIDRRQGERSLAQLEERLGFLENHDPLTGMLNWSRFCERLALMVKGAPLAPVAVAVADVRRFRQVNDGFGREAGNRLLRELAQRLRAHCTDSAIHTRLSGDQFALVLGGACEPDRIAARIERCHLAAVASPFNLDGREIAIDLTFGVAVGQPGAGGVEDLVRNAEVALARAKLSGDRMLFYRPEMRGPAAETVLLESRLRLAIAREEFELHYQPKVEAATGRLAGLEALIRWRDPERGIVPPNEFIPILEETGMILEVGAWVIRKALVESRPWRLTFPGPLRIAVNVSPVQLRRRDFVDAVRRSVGDLGIAAGQLDLEITESMTMDDIEGNVAKLRSLRDMGINIAVDDFGTGYSSLAYLTQLPVNALKIDRSFVATMMSDAQTMTLVSTIISLARSLGLEVIAEGVETPEQAKMLRLLRCDVLQGFLFGRPMPAKEVEEFLRRAAEGERRR